MGEIGSPPPPLRLRLVVLAVVLCAQTAFFGLTLKRPIRLEGDNDRYEQAGWNLATGRGYSLPLHGSGGSNDPEVYEWVCTRHPEACYEDTTHPSALYMPGYSVLVAAVYCVFGRSLLALTMTALVLLWILFALFEQLAAHFLGRHGYFFVMAVAATYPFLARQATIIMSDHLHIVLWLAAFTAFMRLRPGPIRGATFCGLLALATLVRPYSLFVFPVLWLGLALAWKAIGVSRREWSAGVLAFALPFTIWTARNAYWYGHFLPLTTGGAGALLYQASLEWDVDFSDPKNGEAWYKQTFEKYGEIVSRRASQLQTEEALRRIKEHPWKYAGRVAIHVPKLWISTSTRLWVFSVLYLGGLLVLGVAGAWTVRRDARFYPLVVAIAINWVSLLPLAGEARRTLPLRLPMLVLAGAFVGPLLERRLAARSASPLRATS
jgi:4-amino-4-deoxy-L-arabinose transferase-like glycosyltransferase